ncbi:hypothetical protein STVA_36210 [Allostella vacuolata]|nr:hypothetical protein STVA_36210 [Stella vacuolata]
MATTLTVGASETYTTIQSAITAASAGDTILVKAGIYTENVSITKSLTLLSEGGSGTVTIQGADGSNNTVAIAAGVNDVTIGGVGQGFKIIGGDGIASIERAAVYFLGNHDGIEIRNNELVANGDSALISNSNATVTDTVIDSNVFSGTTFDLPTPGTGNQFVDANVPRQFVVMGNGGTGISGSYPTSGIAFTNNQIIGSAGGDNGANPGVIQGNTLVTIDAANSTISGNDFTGFTADYASAIRARGPNTTIENNTLDESTGGNSGGFFIDAKGQLATYAGNSYVGSDDADTISMTPGDDRIDGGAGSDSLVGGDGIDTAAYANGATLAYDGTGWKVTEGADADTLSGIERVEIGDTTYLLVDTLETGGFGSLQAAIDAAADGDIIYVAPGTYTESANYNAADNTNTLTNNPLGLLINKSVSIVGIGTDGTVVDDRADIAATIVSSRQSNWSTNFHVTAENVHISGLEFQGTVTPATPAAGVDKVIEVIRDGFELTHSIVGVVSGQTKLQSAVYINHELGGSAPPIQNYRIDGNELFGGLRITNGVGLGADSSAVMEITNNTFSEISGTTYGNEGIRLVGQDEFDSPPGGAVPWRPLSVEPPTDISGNTFDTGAQWYLFSSDLTPSKIVDADYLEDFVASNDLPSFSYVLDDDVPRLVDQPTYASTFASVKPYGALNVGDALPGDTWIVKAPDGTSSASVSVDGLTVDVQSGSGATTIELTGTAASVTLAGTQSASVAGNDSLANDIVGNGGNNTLEGGSGADTFDGGGGSDRLEGGGGVDVAVYGANATISYSDGAWQVADAGGTDTLVDVEKVVINGTNYLLVDTAGAGFGTIAEAHEAAANGDVILLADGTYTGQVNLDITKSVTIDGLGTGAIIDGQLRESNGNYEGSTAAFIQGEASVVAAGDAFRITGSNVTIRDLTIREYTNGVALTGGDSVRIENVTFEDNLIGVRKGTAAAVDGFTMVGGSIRDGQAGMTIYADTAVGSFENVRIEDVQFEDLFFKGIYAEQLGNATITGISMEDVGEYGNPNGVGTFGNGIDINLKHRNYSDILIEDFEFTNVGHSSGASTVPGATGAAIAVKARDDGGYAAVPATLDDVVIRNGTIDGTSTGIRLGEPGQVNAGPTNVLVQAVGITDAALGAYDNRTSSVLTVQGTGGADAVLASGSATGRFNLNGNVGTDTVQGGPANDTLYGGADNDTVIASGGTDLFSGGAGTDMVRVPSGGFGSKAFLTVTDFSIGEAVDLSALGTPSATGNDAASLTQGQYKITATQVGSTWQHVVEIGIDGAAGSDLQLTLVSDQELEGTLSSGILTFSTSTPAVPVYADYVFEWSPRGLVAVAAGTPAGFTGANLVASPGAGWEFRGTGDFNNDGQDDLLWWNPGLSAAAYSLRTGNTTFSAMQWIGGPGDGWIVADIADVTGNGADDLIWTTADGSDVRVSNGASAAGTSITLSGDWVYGGVGNFDGNGYDIVWRSDAFNGIALTELTSNANPRGIGVDPDPDPDGSWDIVEVADLTGDGRHEVISANDDLSKVIITNFASGSGNQVSTLISGVGAGWSFVASGSFGGVSDGLLWKNADGTAYAIVELSLNSTTGIFATSYQGLFISDDWKVDRVYNADGIGADEILIHNDALDGYAILRQSEGYALDTADWIGNMLSTDVWRSGYPGNVSPGAGWTLDRFADLDGDGIDDTLWWNAATGEAAWRAVDVDGNLGATTAIGSPGSGYTIGWVAEVVGDDRDDIVWVSGNGQTVVVSEGPSTAGTPVGINSEFVFAGIGDIGDGVQLLWQTAEAPNGLASTELDGTNPTWLDGHHAGAGWDLVAVADFLGDNTVNYLWQNASLPGGVAFTTPDEIGPPPVTEQTAVWFSAPEPTGWVLEAFGDVDGGGDLELVWQRTSDGMLAISRLGENGSGEIVPSEPNVWVGMPGAGWDVDSLVDTDGDGEQEILWFNATLNGYALQRNPFDIGTMDWIGNPPGGSIASIETWRLDQWRIEDTANFAT